MVAYLPDRWSTCEFQSNQGDIHLIKKKKVEEENHLLQAIL